jgi:hypothetical protein
MVSLNYQYQAAEACATIASSSIDAIHTFHTSTFQQRTDRYSSVIYLAGAIIPLTCIIIREEGKDNDNALRMKASDTFHKALAILQDIATGHTFARNMLQRLRRIVDAANKKIVSRLPVADFDISEKGGQSRGDPRIGIQHASSFGLIPLSSEQLQYTNDLFDDSGRFGGNLRDLGGGDMLWSVSEMDMFDALFENEARAQLS